MFEDLQPRTLFEQREDLVVDFCERLDKALLGWSQFGFPTDNDACIEAAILFCTAEDAIYEYINSKVPADGVEWWGTHEAIAYRAMAICLVEIYVERS